MKLAYAMCGSFCTHANALETMRLLARENDITPVLSEICSVTDTRFSSAKDLLSAVTEIAGKDPVLTIPQAEETVTRGGFDALVIAPCTGNTMAKIALGMTDTAVAMCAKAQLRSDRPVLIAPATNDGLGASFHNIGTLMNKKNVWFVPFRQDDPENKPHSLVADFSLLPDALACAVRGKQVQPVMRELRIQN